MTLLADKKQSDRNPRTPEEARALVRHVESLLLTARSRANMRSPRRQ
jgi:hypothetical protein